MILHAYFHPRCVVFLTSSSRLCHTVRVGRTIGRKFGTLQQSNGVCPQNESVPHYFFAFFLSSSLKLYLTSLSLSLSQCLLFTGTLSEMQSTSLLLHFLLYVQYYFNWFPCLFRRTTNNCRGSGGCLYWLDKANRNVTVAVGTDKLRPSAINRRVDTREIARE